MAQPVRDRRRAVAAGLILAVALVAGIGSWLGLSYTPNAGKNIFDNEAAFRAHVEAMNLGSLSTAAALERLAAEGFRCDTFRDGSSACHRAVQGSNCGERQFVDILPSTTAGTAHTVSIRFGLACL